MKINWETNKGRSKPDIVLCFAKLRHITIQNCLTLIKKHGIKPQFNYKLLQQRKHGGAISLIMEFNNFFTEEISNIYLFNEPFHDNEWVKWDL